MGIFDNKASFGHLFSGRTASAADSSAPCRLADTLAFDIVFDESNEQQQLSHLLCACRTDDADAAKHFAVFVHTLIGHLKGWQPSEGVPREAAAASSWLSSFNTKRKTVRGTDFGHPKEVTERLVHVLYNYFYSTGYVMQDKAASQRTPQLAAYRPIAGLQRHPTLAKNSVWALREMLRVDYDRRAFLTAGGLHLCAGVLEQAAEQSESTRGLGAVDVALSLLSALVQGEAAAAAARASLTTAPKDGKKETSPGRKVSSSGQQLQRTSSAVNAVGKNTHLDAIVMQQPGLVTGPATLLSATHASPSVLGDDRNVVQQKQAELVTLLFTLTEHSEAAASALAGVRSLVPVLCAIVRVAAGLPGDRAQDAPAGAHGRSAHSFSTAVRALCTLRHVLQSQSHVANGEDPTAMSLFNAGLYQAVSMLLLHAADPDDSVALEADFASSVPSSAGARPIFGTLHASLPPRLPHDRPALFALVLELGHWVSERHSASVGSGVLAQRTFVLVHMACAWMDCFVHGDASKLQLQRPAEDAEAFLSRVARVTDASTDLQHCFLAFLKLLLQTVPSAPEHLHRHGLVPLLMGPVFALRGLAEVTRPTLDAASSHANGDRSSDLDVLAGDTFEASMFSGITDSLHAAADRADSAFCSTLDSVQEQPPSSAFHGPETPPDLDRDTRAESPPSSRPHHAASASADALVVTQGFEAAEPGSAKHPRRRPAKRIPGVRSTSQLSEAVRNGLDATGSQVCGTGSQARASMEDAHRPPWGAEVGSSGGAAPATMPPMPPCDIKSSQDASAASLPIAIVSKTAFSPPRPSCEPGAAGADEGTPQDPALHASPASLLDVGKSDALSHAASAKSCSWRDTFVPHQHSLPGSSPGCLTGSYCYIDANSDLIARSSSTRRIRMSSNCGASAGQAALQAAFGSYPSPRRLNILRDVSFNRSRDSGAPDTIYKVTAPLAAQVAEDEELQVTTLQLFELWVFRRIVAQAMPDEEIRVLLDRVQRSTPAARHFAVLALKTLQRMLKNTSDVSEPVVAALIRASTPRTFVDLMCSVRDLLEQSTWPGTPPDICAQEVSPDSETHELCELLIDILQDMLTQYPAPSAAALAETPVAASLLGLAAKGVHAVVPILSSVLFASIPAPQWKALAEHYLDLLSRSVADPDALPLTVALLHGLRGAGSARALPRLRRARNALRDAGALDTILGLGAHLGPAFECGSDAAKTVAKEGLATVQALVRGDDAMRAHFSQGTGLEAVQQLVLACMGTQAPQRDLLEVCLSIVLEEEYRSGSPVNQEIAHPGAIELFFRMLMQSALDDALWGLTVWHRLIATSLANVEACKEGKLVSLILEWIGARETPPVVQVRLACLLQVLSAHAVTSLEFRQLFRLMQPDMGQEGAVVAWKSFAADPPAVDEARRRCCLHSTAVLLQKVLCRTTYEAGPAAFFNLCPQGDGTGGFQRSSSDAPLPLPPGAVYTFATWLRLEPYPAAAGRATFSTSRCIFALLSNDPVADAHNPSVPPPSGSALLVRDGRLVFLSLHPRKHDTTLGHHELQPRVWYHIVVTVNGRPGMIQAASSINAPVALYVNGKQVDSGSVHVPYPSVMRHYVVGNRLPMRVSDWSEGPLEALRAQLGCVYLFGRSLSANEVGLLHTLGHEYQGTFLPCESSPMLYARRSEVGVIFHESKGLSRHLGAAYAPRAHYGSALLDISSPGLRNQHLSMAQLLPGATICASSRPREMLNCLGGVAVLLPFFLLVGVTVAPPDAGWLTKQDAALLCTMSELETARSDGTNGAATAYDVLSARRAEEGSLETYASLLSGDINESDGQCEMALCALRMLQSALEEDKHRYALHKLGGGPLIGALLRRLPPSVRSPPFVHALRQFVRTVQAAAPDSALSMSLAQHTLGDLTLWASTPAHVQQAVLKHLIDSVVLSVPGSQGLDVVDVVDAIRRLNHGALDLGAVELSSAGTTPPPATLSPATLSREDVKSLSTRLLELASALLQGSAGNMTSMTFRAFVAFADSSNDEELAASVLTLLRSLGHAKLSALAAPFGGARIFLPLLQRPQPSVRHAAFPLVLDLLPADPTPNASMSGHGRRNNSNTNDSSRSAHADRSAVQDVVANWDLSVPGTLDALLRAVTGTPANLSPRLDGARLVRPFLMPALLAAASACNDAETRRRALRHAALFAPQNSMALLGVSNWQPPLLELLARAYPVADGDTSAEAPPERAPVLRLLCSTLSAALMSSASGADDLAALIAFLRMPHHAGAVDVVSATVDVLASVLEDVTTRVLAPWDAIATYASGCSSSGGSMSRDDRASSALSSDSAMEWDVVADWETCLCEPILSNMSALLSTVEELFAGLLFAPTAARQQTPAGALAWARDHWVAQPPHSTGSAGDPAALFGCVPVDIWATLGVCTEGACSLSPLPAQVWHSLAPCVWKLLPWTLLATSNHRTAAATSPVSSNGLANGSKGAAAEDASSKGPSASSHGDVTHEPSEMLRVARAAQPLRICMLLMLRALCLPAADCLAVLKHSRDALSNAVRFSGKAIFSHVHLVVLVLHCATQRRVRGAADGADAALPPLAPDERAALRVLADRVIEDQQHCVAVSLHSSEHAHAMLQAAAHEGRAGATLRFLMPTRIAAAAAAEVRWHEAARVQRTCVDSNTLARAAESTASLIRVREEAHEVASSSLAAIDQADARRREADAAAARSVRDDASRKLRKMLRAVTCEHGAWAAEALSARRGGMKLLSWEDEHRRRIYLRSDTAPPAQTTLEVAPPGDLQAVRTGQPNATQSSTDVLPETSNASHPCTSEAPSSINTSLHNGPGPQRDGGAELDGTGDLEDAAVSRSPPARGAPSLDAVSSSFAAFGTDGGRGGSAAVQAVDCSLITLTSSLKGKLRLEGQHLRFVASQVSKVRSWSLAAISEVHLDLHLLQPNALQLYFRPSEGVASPVLLITDPLSDPRPHKTSAHTRIHDFGAKLASAAHATLFDRRRKQAEAEAAARRWAAGELPNFDYLMTLNTLAGRSYDDLGQYPIFPWVLADWTSPSLDLRNPDCFRDFTKPMGALEPRRLRDYQERFMSLMESGDTSCSDGGGAAFLYGTHYSNPGIVLWYLVRLQPFSQLSRSLQGGRFDHAARMFHSIPEAWSHALTNSSDVKEMVPEFFHLPSFLQNHSGYELGVRSDGERVSDVVLPPWAHGSVHEFIRIHREALESEHVSQHLHAWIDLVFGYRQTGTAALEADNIFHPATYEAGIDVAAMQPAARSAALHQIRDFGQTPVQLFFKRHPKRVPLPPTAAALLHAPEAVRRAQGASPFLYVDGGAHASDMSGVPVVALMLGETHKGARLVHVTAQHKVCAHKWQTAGSMAYTFSGGLAQIDSDFLIEPDTTPARPFLAPGNVIQSPAAYAHIPRTSLLVSAGQWDGSIRVHDIESGALQQSVTVHSGVVSCLSLTTDSDDFTHTLAAGSADTLVSIWRLAVTGGSRSGRRAAPLESSSMFYLYGHGAPITALWASAPLRCIVSASACGSVLLHHLYTGELLRSIAALPVPITLLTGSPLQPAAVAYSAADKTLRAWHLSSGAMLAETVVEESISALAVTPCGRRLLAGGGRVEDPARKGHTAAAPLLMWLHNLKRVMRYHAQIPAQEGEITVMLATKESCIIVGTAKGAVVLLSPDTRRNITPIASLTECHHDERA